MKKFFEILDRINFKCITNLLLADLFLLYFQYVVVKYHISTFDSIFTILTIGFSISFITRAFFIIKNNNK